MDMERVIAFAITAIIIWILKGVIKFGMKLLVLLLIGAAVVWFVFPEMIPAIQDFLTGFMDGIMEPQ